MISIKNVTRTTKIKYGDYKVIKRCYMRSEENANCYESTLTFRINVKYKQEKVVGTTNK